MSLHDSPDGKEIDGRGEPLAQRRATVGSSSGASPSGGGQTIQVDPKLLGCGCFIPSALCIFTGCVVLMVMLLAFVIPAWRVNHRYVANSCVVLDKRLDSEMFRAALKGGGQGKESPSYRPAIQIRYEVNGQKFEVWAYDGFGVYSSDKAAVQARVDRFQVGATYPCWYDPDRPDQAVLERGNIGGAYAALILPVGLLTVGGIGMVIAWKLASSKAAPLAPMPVGPPTAAPTRPAPARAASGLSPWVQSLARHFKPFDPSSLGDPVALKTEWTQLSRVSLNQRSRKLVEAGPDRREFRGLPGFLLLAFLFSLFFIFGPVSVLSTGRLPLGWNPSTILALLLVLSAVVGVGYAIHRVRIPIVFDKETGWFWKGRVAPDESSDERGPEASARLRDIHALQLLRFRSGYQLLYELNLVLNDGQRVHVLAHGHRVGLREDAEALAEFLQRPVWDAI
jgi:hypothetical protein